ncbi:MAG: di-trans,poly-cis-decaprenylcistransferase [Clostridia bacterium]|nr:di-trans,poly-cis-decaprenylcistransferase [Clostridia bacterium]MBQ7339220.1 di-trans,poly-cis-decaprenylcistransferase [Clostridia bacterium]
MAAEKEKNIPQLDDKLKHIAFIMDGNGRWAQRRGMPRMAGHRAGAKTFQTLSHYCADVGLKIMTVYAFSTENWKRPAAEVNALMELMDYYLDNSERLMRKRSIRFRFIGDTTALPEKLQRKIADLEDSTKNNDMILNIALNYGARAEITRAYRVLRERGIENPTEQDVSDAMYTGGFADPDLIVRTGGDLRISNFLLWQAAYSELYFTDKLWPELTTDDIDEIIREFYTRKRRFGDV